MRLFAALSLPPEAVDRLLSLRLRLSDPRDGLRWSTPEQWHITLHFFGEVQQDASVLLKGEMEQVVSEPVDLTLESLGTFAAKGILYAAVITSPGLEGLHAAVGRAAQACGLPIEPRRFHPHITLARAKGRVGHHTLQQLARPNLPALGQPIQWRATELLLLESVLRPSGAEYSVLCRKELNGRPETGAVALTL